MASKLTEKSTIQDLARTFSLMAKEIGHEDAEEIITATANSTFKATKSQTTESEIVGQVDESSSATLNQLIINLEGQRSEPEYRTRRAFRAYRKHILFWTLLISTLALLGAIAHSPLDADGFLCRRLYTSAAAEHEHPIARLSRKANSNIICPNTTLTAAPAYLQNTIWMAWSLLYIFVELSFWAIAKSTNSFRSERPSIGQLFLVLFCAYLFVGFLIK